MSHGSAGEMAAGEPNCLRWTQQRWLIDNIIRSNGVEFDQGRLSIIQALAGVAEVAHAEV
jgi:hypothetical protein